jgi:hypothetical protein
VGKTGTTAGRKGEKRLFLYAAAAAQATPVQSIAVARADMRQFKPVSANSSQFLPVFASFCQFASFKIPIPANCHSEPRRASA